MFVERSVLRTTGVSGHGHYVRGRDSESAVVFVRTDAVPEELVDAVVERAVKWVWHEKQRAIVECLRDAAGPLSSREIAEQTSASK